MDMRGKIEVYKADDGWRWRLLATNGEPLSHGGEAFSSKQACKKSISVIAECFQGYSEDEMLIESD